jgi:hypothetical protein
MQHNVSKSSDLQRLEIDGSNIEDSDYSFDVNARCFKRKRQRVSLSPTTGRLQFQCLHQRCLAPAPYIFNLSAFPLHYKCKGRHQRC